MTRWTQNIWRLATKLHQAYVRQQRSRLIPMLPDASWRDVHRRLRLLTLIESRGWLSASRRLRRDAAHDLDCLAHLLRDVCAQCSSIQPQVVPAARALYEELIAIEDDFGSIVIDDAEIVVVTEPIELEGIGFGPFAVRLNLRQLDCDMPYTVVALEPNPAASSSETTHPHVHGDCLCQGEGRAAIQAALDEGRLFDFFTVVDQILHTYAEGSAYVELNHWSGTPCRDCAAIVDDEDACLCGGCEETLCNDCLIACGNCGSGYCSSCTNRCSACDDACCSHCMSACTHCQRELCEACLSDGMCFKCQEELEDEDESQETTPAAVPRGAKPAAQPAV